MEGLVPATAAATAPTFQLILEHLCAILLLISESLRRVPALPVLLSVILVGALGAVSLMVKRRLTSGSVKAPDKRCPARDEVCAGRSENTGPMTEADDTPMPPGVEASPLWLQTLCLKALNKHLSCMLSLQDLADLVRTVRGIQPPRRSRVTHEKPVTKAPGTDREQLQENTPGDLNKNTRHPESPELRQDEIVGWKQDVQDEEEEEKQGLELWTAPVERDLQGTVSQSLSLVGAPLQTSPRPEVLRGHSAHVKSQVRCQKEAGNADQSVHGSEGDLKGVPHDADLNVSLPRADEDAQGRAQELWEQKQITEELAAEIMSLQTEKASLQCENTDLNAEIQQLKLKLQVQPGIYEDRLTHLQKQLFEAERHRSEMEKKLLNDWRKMKSTYEMLNTCRKMAQDMNQELRRTTFYYEKEIRYHWERAEAARMAAENTERKLQELWRETDRNRQLLAKARCTFWPFPGGPFAPAAPPAAYRGPEMPVPPLGHWVPRKEQGHAVRARTQEHLQV